MEDWVLPQKHQDSFDNSLPVQINCSTRYPRAFIDLIWWTYGGYAHMFSVKYFVWHKAILICGSYLLSHGPWWLLRNIYIKPQSIPNPAECLLHNNHRGPSVNKYHWYDMMLPAQADVPICWASLWNSVIWRKALCSSVSHFIQLPFLSSSSSLSYLLLHPPLLLLLFLIFHFVVFHFSLSSFIASFSLYLLYSSSFDILLCSFLFILFILNLPLHYPLLW